MGRSSLLLHFLAVSLFCQESHAVKGSPDIRTQHADALPVAPSAVFQCPPDGEHHFHADTCNSYTSCTEGIEIYEECPEGLLYNPDTPPDIYPCDDPANVTCFLPLAPVCHSEDPHHLPHPDNIGAFYECRGGVASRRMCPEELLYNTLSPATRYPCDYPENVFGALPPPPTPPPTTRRPIIPFPPQGPNNPQPDEPNKVFNFYTYVTNHW